MRHRFLLILLALALAGPLFAQTVGNAVRIPLFSDMDFDTVGSYMYCVTQGTGDDPGAQGKVVNIPVLTVGSSTTVTVVTAGTGAFQNMSVGDEITFPLATLTPAGTQTQPGNESVRYIVTKTSADSVVLNAAINLAVPAGRGYPFTWRKRVCGTTASDGWFSTSSWQDFTVSFQADQGDATSLDAALQCETFGAASAPIQVWTANYLLAVYGNVSTGRTAIYVVNHFDRCRLGVRLTDDASDAGANLEKVSAYVRGRRPNP
jgi:hypothetical protein